MNSDPATLPIIDSHQHLWNLDEIQLPWLSDPAYQSIARTFSPADYAAATAGYNVVRTVYLEVDVDPNDHTAEAESITALGQSPGSHIGGAIFGCRPAAEAFEDWIDVLAANPLVRGVREVLFDRPTDHCLNPRFLRSVQSLASHGLLFEIETPREQLPHSLKLVDHCPDTQFVLDHCGHPKLGERDATWEQSVADLANRHNVVVKISGLFSGAHPEFCTPDAIAPAVRHLLEVFGPDRVLFGSDWPVVTLSSSFADWTDAVFHVTSDCSPSEIQNLFHDNSRRIYRLA